MEEKCICTDKQILLCNAKKHQCICGIYKPKIYIEGMGFNLKKYCRACLNN